MVTPLRRRLCCRGHESGSRVSRHGDRRPAELVATGVTKRRACYRSMWAQRMASTGKTKFEACGWRVCGAPGRGGAQGGVHKGGCTRGGGTRGGPQGGVAHLTPAGADWLVVFADGKARL